MIFRCVIMPEDRKALDKDNPRTAKEVHSFHHRGTHPLADNHLSPRPLPTPPPTTLSSSDSPDSLPLPSYS